MAKPPRPTAEFAINSPMINVDEILPPSGNNKRNCGAGPKCRKLRRVFRLLYRLLESILKVRYNRRADPLYGSYYEQPFCPGKGKNDISDVFIKTGYSGGVITDKIHADLRNMKKVSFTNSISVSNVEINDLMICASNFIKPANPLYREVVNLKNNLYGKINGTSTISGQGMTSDDIMKSLNGVIVGKITNGKITNSVIFKNISGVLEKFIKLDDITFRDMSMTLRIADQKVFLDEMKMNSDVAGDWFAIDL